MSTCWGTLLGKGGRRVVAVPRNGPCSVARFSRQKLGEASRVSDVPGIPQADVGFTHSPRFAQCQQLPSITMVAAADRLKSLVQERLNCDAL